MAKRTEGFDEAILFYAKKEFLEKGYENASLRTIAGSASVSTSTIYTRYKDKEGLFKAIVDPAARKLIEYNNSYLNNFEMLDSDTQISSREDYSEEGFKGFLDILYEYFDEFKLITSSSTNGLYRYYFEQIVEVNEKCTINFLKISNNRFYLEGRLTDGFIHVVCSAFYAGLFEIAVQDMERKEAEKYALELRNFYNNGWKLYL